MTPAANVASKRTERGNRRRQGVRRAIDKDGCFSCGKKHYETDGTARMDPWDVVEELTSEAVAVVVVAAAELYKATEDTTMATGFNPAGGGKEVSKVATTGHSHTMRTATTAMRGTVKAGAPQSIKTTTTALDHRRMHRISTPMDPMDPARTMAETSSSASWPKSNSAAPWPLASLQKPTRVLLNPEQRITLCIREVYLSRTNKSKPRLLSLHQASHV